DAGLRAAELLVLVERTHPWAILQAPLDRDRLAAALRDALASAMEGPPTELTQRFVRPPAPSFEKLISDPLTGVEGYHHLRWRLDEELEPAARYSRPLPLALIDLDDLRGLNDRHGREVGDWALKQVAAAVLSSARPLDRVGRWAGGLFALILPETQ